MSGWERLAFSNTRSTTTNANDTLSTGTFTPKKYLHVETYYSYADSGNDPKMSFNTDVSTSNYNYRRSIDNSATDAPTSGDGAISNNAAGGSNRFFERIDIVNILADEKQALIRVYYAGEGATDDPHWRWYASKWADLTEQITKINIIMGSGSIDDGSCITVWGTDDPIATYPKLQDGSIYEEQDTGKIYIWKLSTNTWSEVT